MKIGLNGSPQPRSVAGQVRVRGNQNHVCVCVCVCVLYAHNFIQKTLEDSNLFRDRRGVIGCLVTFHKNYFQGISANIVETIIPTQSAMCVCVCVCVQRTGAGLHCTYSCQN